jgi:hypothetical protein
MGLRAVVQSMQPCLTQPAQSDAKASDNLPSRKSRQAPKKRTTFLTQQAALAISTSCHLSSSDFHDFVCARSFDIILGGMYRKFLVQSRAAKEEWAFGVQSSISKLQKQIKTIAGIVHSVVAAENKPG